MKPDYKNAWETLKETLQRIFYELQEDESSRDHEAAVFATLMTMKSIEQDNNIKEECDGER